MIHWETSPSRSSAHSRNRAAAPKLPAIAGENLQRPGATETRFRARPKTFSINQRRSPVELRGVKRVTQSKSRQAFTLRLTWTFCRETNNRVRRANISLLLFACARPPTNVRGTFAVHSGFTSRRMLRIRNRGLFGKKKKKKKNRPTIAMISRVCDETLYARSQTAQ